MNEQIGGKLGQSAYGSIKMLIITGQLAPGSRVTEGDLANLLKVSRTPIREALSRLDRDGFVLPRTRNGYSVMPIDADSVNEAFDVRDLLEVQTTRLTVRRIDDKGCQLLRDMIRECDNLANISGRCFEDDVREMQIGIDLHRAIASMCGNGLLSGMLDGVLDRCQAYVWLDLSNLNSFAAARNSHREIVEAICSQSEDNAVELTRRHISSARENILSVLRQRQHIQNLMGATSPIDRSR